MNVEIQSVMAVCSKDFGHKQAMNRAHSRNHLQIQGLATHKYTQ